MHRILAGECAHQGPHLVGIAQLEPRVLHQLAHPGHGVACRCRSLQAQPLVHYQAVVTPVGIERLQRRFPLRLRAIERDAPQGGQAIGHIAGLL